FGADRYLRIGHRAEPPHAGYYFSSSVGRRWAQRTAAWLGRLGWPAPPVTEDAQYPLQQSSCPAIYVSTARVDDPASEERMNAAGAARSEAYALFLGLIGEWSEAELPADSLRVHDAQGRPAAGRSSRSERHSSSRRTARALCVSRAPNQVRSKRAPNIQPSMHARFC